MEIRYPGERREPESLHLYEAGERFKLYLPGCDIEQSVHDMRVETTVYALTGGEPRWEWRDEVCASDMEVVR